MVMAGCSTICAILLASLAAVVHCEVFSALATLTDSLHREKVLAHGLRQYVELEQNRLQKVLALADDYDEHADRALVNAESYIANPINAYLFVKKFTSELPQTQELVSSDENSRLFLDMLEEHRPYLPDNEDLEGVVAAVLRLQDTYELTSQRIADGTFTPINRSPPLTAADCYQFGVHAHDRQDYYHTLLWMEEAHTRRLREASNSTASLPSILDYLSFACYNQGNLRHAKYLTEQWIKLEPNHDRALSNLIYFNNEIEKEEASKLESKTGDDGVLPPLKNKRTADSYRSGAEFKTYEALCRGEDVKPNPYVHKLRCFYTTSGDHPLLMLAPVKVEEFYLDPYIVLYHDVISDKEIKVMKEISTPKLARATVNDPATGKLVTAHYRVSKSAWLRDEMHPTVQTLSNRISAITHLSMEKAEDLQIQNYGIGGQYEPHCDHARRTREMDTFSEDEGNRIATWMFYFTDVDAGGLTVFTQIGAKIPPVKGAAAFWHNLKPDGEGDDNTRHAGCPVLSGSKWVANKWIHERGQEFMRPCGLSPN
ncbi:prolyl 4-hydroxylase subunit alpha-1-like isoform X1 [Watersipora subatra]|uniref:prolyl 4-hydroxylase subunit alpha-1-like isoform X1 n=2 Tax=Watersipora subatra TaxID=2589382 RepID=UPI00355C6C46